MICEDSLKIEFLGEEENNANNFAFPEEYEINSDETEDVEYCNFNSVQRNPSDENILMPRHAEPPRVKPVGNDIWGPPTSLFSWTPSDLSGSPSNLTSDTVSAISLSRLLRFEEKKVRIEARHSSRMNSDIADFWFEFEFYFQEKVKEDIEQYRSLSSLWSTDTKSLWSHPKQEWDFFGYFFYYFVFLSFSLFVIVFPFL